MAMAISVISHHPARLRGAEAIANGCFINNPGTIGYPSDVPCPSPIPVPANAAPTGEVGLRPQALEPFTTRVPSPARSLSHLAFLCLNSRLY